MGVGIMGKEGRQAVNNSDYAVAQFRFLTRLLLLHGSLSAYRLSRLIKYSFYKNIAFGGMLFFYQFYCGFSGQARPRAPPKKCRLMVRGSGMRANANLTSKRLSSAIAGAWVDMPVLLLEGAAAFCHRDMYQPLY